MPLLIDVPAATDCDPAVQVDVPCVQLDPTLLGTVHVAGGGGADAVQVELTALNEPFVQLYVTVPVVGAAVSVNTKFEPLGIALPEG